MIHHITLSQLRTFTPPATQFGTDNEPYMVIQVNRDPMDFQQLTSFLYEFAYPIPASREDLLMTSAYLSNIKSEFYYTLSEQKNKPGPHVILHKGTGTRKAENQGS